LRALPHELPGVIDPGLILASFEDLEGLIQKWQVTPLPLLALLPAQCPWQHVGMSQNDPQTIGFPPKKNSLINFGSQLEVPDVPSQQQAAMVEGLQLAPQKLRNTLEVKFHNSSWNDIIVYYIIFIKAV